MQLIADAIAVLGSRHGVLLDPVQRRCGIVRYDSFNHLPELHIRAGAIIAGKEYILPLTPQSSTQGFYFHDQRLTPCSMSIMGIQPNAALKVKLTVVTPFRPRDAAFSTTPVLGLKVEAETLKGHFRWMKHDIELKDVEVFIEFSGPLLTVEDSGTDSLDLVFTSQRFGRAFKDSSPVAQRDRLVALTGQKTGKRFVQKIDLTTAASQTGANALQLAWCTFDKDGLQILGSLYPFHYTRKFSSLVAVADWARKNGRELWQNAAKVDGIVAANNCGQAVNSLLANTLHSWLIDTWYIDRGGRDWFSVWEGSCYFHSTVDVEFTQAPFYLSLWPELMGIELDFWPEYSKDGEKSIGERGRGTLFLSHDTGSGSCADGQDYPHEMEVEENANYIIMAFSYWRRTKDDSLLRRHAESLEKYLRFIIACDTRGHGVPALGVANTIDDASPAVQFGREQIYLAVKAMTAFDAGAEIMIHLQRKDFAGQCKKLAAKIRKIVNSKGWKKDHFVTLLDKRGEGLVNPWNNEKLNLKEVPGWDAAHIYTVNALAVMDMLGYRSGINEERIKIDLRVATQRCLREYGCVHSDFGVDPAKNARQMQGLAGVSRNPGWISMNMLRDMAAFYRGVDLRPLAERYWNWQTTTNAQEAKIFFETFNGNNLCFYPRGVAIWGYFEALAGLVIDKVKRVDKATPKFPQTRVPRLFDANWKKGTCRVIES